MLIIFLLSRKYQMKLQFQHFGRLFSVRINLTNPTANRVPPPPPLHQQFNNGIR
uniref:Uncharacterized protein n=1 Tax=Picea sitchensis TaxID=3332 RepID=D5A8H7_PICSI|nr:unknown [Picea sitchensis]